GGAAAGTGSAPVDALAFSPDGTQLAAANGDQVKVYDPAGGGLRHTLAAPNRVSAVAFSPDGKRLAGGCINRSVVIWDAGTGQVVHTLSTLKAPPTSVAWSPDGNLLAVAAGDPNPYADRRGNVRSEFRLFDPAAGQEVAALEDPGDTVTAVAFLPDGKRFVTGAVDGSVRVWDAAARQPVGPAAAHAPGVGVVSLGVSPDGKVLATGGQDNAVVVWDPAALKPVARLEGHGDRVNAIVFAAAGLVTACEDGSAWVWDVEKKARRHELQGAGPHLFAAAATRDGKQVATGGVGGVVRVWDGANPGPARLELR
ncbi:MAG: WD40 repeat domain-containing protein, partial [Gemmataceae bacterium]|nr:WD40 repeat domain-containing protein [Gemmataceae bacterium]